MEALVSTQTGVCISVQPNGFTWGTMEDHGRYIAALRDPEAWHGRLCLIRVPDLPYAEGERYKGGTFPIDAITAPVMQMASWEFAMLAEIADGD